jgi:hypothetical protein
MENIKKLKYSKKILIIMFIVSLMAILGFGCTTNVILPSVNPNPAANPDNDTLIYVTVSPTSASVKVGESVQIIVKGYNSDDEWIILDKSKVYSWDWTVQGQCYLCIKPFVELSPKSGSLTTTFSSGKTGTFFVVVYYLESAGDDYITDYTEITVTK